MAIEHQGLKDAKSVKELAEIFNKMDAKDKKKFKPYYEIRHLEFVEAA